ncbi:MAG TPA: hypothetical protein VGS61_06525, partial [Acidimicrobiales bacterium]|nr:hypothetical protein [Acidimicrobiales bacterium]
MGLVTTDALAVVVAPTRRRVDRETVIGAIMTALGLFCAWAFGLGSVPRARSILEFDPVNTSGAVP